MNDDIRGAVDLSSEFLGIRSPNPFWLASAPPTDKAYNVNRAFEAGWGGVVWKTLGEDPPIVNVSGPRYGAIHGNDRRVIGFNNVELITDRPLATNLAEIRQIKRDWPDRALVVSVMLPMNREAWAKYVPMIEDTGADALELNFGCPHGMSERGMGAAVGQVPEYIQQATAWAKEAARIPVIVKLTPNVTNILPPAKAARDGGADAVSLINTMNSIMRVDYDTLSMYPATDGKGSHGGYCGPAVKPIALHMVAEIARHRETAGLPISGIGGVTDWRDAVDFLALGASNVQVCTAAMVYGFRIIDDLRSGLAHFLRDKGMARVADLVGRAVPSVTDWQYLNLNYVVKARINQDLCIQCGRCHIVCEDASHQAITHTVDGKRRFEVIDAECVGCNLCVSVCPVIDCITMEQLTTGIDTRTGQAITAEKADWTSHPNNPMRRPKGMTPDYPGMLRVAIEEARTGLAEGGIPIGAALFDAGGQVLGRGHNRRVQEGDPSVHGETDAFRKAGRQRSYRDKIMVTTLAPCWYCSGLVRQFNIGTVVVGESVNFSGGVQWLRDHGVTVIDLASAECIEMLGSYIRANPGVWNEDIGEDPTR